MIYRWLSLFIAAPFALIGATMPSVAEPVVGGDITVTERIVFDGYEGWTHDGITYRLACGVVLAQAPNGDFLATWLSGPDREPTPENAALLARSTDGGVTWSQPQVLVRPRDGMAGIVTNVYPTADGRLVLYGAHFPPEESYTRWHYFRMLSDDSGRTWSAPEPFLLRDGNGSLGQGEAPIRLPDGRWLYVGHWYIRREKPLVAPARELAQAADESAAQAMQPGEGRGAGSFASHLMGVQAYVADSDHGTEFTPLGAMHNRPLGLIEPTATLLRDGAIAVLMRGDFGGFLWRTQSTDGGQTWLPAKPTDIPNPSSMSDLVRLRDGRIALIHNPNGGVVGERARRDPLAIWISDDEMKTWSVKADIATGGQLAYPDSIMLDSGRLVLAYDRDRRQIRFVEVHLPATAQRRQGPVHDRD